MKKKLLTLMVVLSLLLGAVTTFADPNDPLPPIDPQSTPIHEVQE